MTYTPMFPKPGQIKKKKEPVKVFPDGREICDLKNTEGRRIYMDRKRQMWERQEHKCCMYGKLPGFTACRGNHPRRNGWIKLDESYFDHENGRGAGKQDDRIEKEITLEDGTKKVIPINGAICGPCNMEKGSRRVAYNTDFLEAI